MFYKYKVSYWLDGDLLDGCGIVFGKTIMEATEYLSQWYGSEYMANLAMDAIDLDTTCPVLDFNTNYEVLDNAVEAMEQC